MEPNVPQRQPGTAPRPQARSQLEVPDALDVGLTGWPVMLFLVGIAFLVLRGLLTSIMVTSDDPSEGLADTGVWFGWLGITTLSLGLIGAGFRGRQVPVGGRIAFILVGAYLLQAGSTGIADAFASLFGAF